MEEILNKTVVVQSLKRTVGDDSLNMAEKYYSLLSAINDLHLTQREIQLISFTAVKGNMSYANIREDFCKRYETTSPTINNIISKLKKLGILIKDRGKIKVRTSLLLNFNLDVTLVIKLLHND